MKGRIEFVLSEEKKKKLKEVTDDIIDRLYNYHKLSPLECGMALEFLRKSYEVTMTQLWEEDEKVQKDLVKNG